jgi:hypothetical protein
MEYFFFKLTSIILVCLANFSVVAHRNAYTGGKTICWIEQPLHVTKYGILVSVRIMNIEEIVPFFGVKFLKFRENMTREFKNQ